MLINVTNGIGLFFCVCLICIALWQVYAKWRSYRNIQHGRVIWAAVTNITSELRTISIGTRQILKSEDFLSMTWKDAHNDNTHTFKIKVPDAYTPKIGEMLPIRVGSDGFRTYRLDLKQLQSRPTSVAKPHQQVKETKGYDTALGHIEEYETPKTSYPMQLPEQK
jgi:hypothetical protein